MTQEQQPNETTELWKEYKGSRQQKKQNNMAFSTALLRNHGINYQSFNGGNHLKVGDYNFWPSTGLFINSKTQERGRGIKNLLMRVKP